MAEIIYQLAAYLAGGGILLLLARLMVRVRPGSLLHAGLIAMMRSLTAPAAVAAWMLAAAPDVFRAHICLFLRHLPRTLGISARFSSIYLILYHSFKVPDGRPA